MMHSDRLGVMMYSEKMRVEVLRMLQGTKSKVMQMIRESVKVGEGILLNKHMVVIP